MRPGSWRSSAATWPRASPRSSAALGSRPARLRVRRGRGPYANVLALETSVKGLYALLLEISGKDLSPERGAARRGE